MSDPPETPYPPVRSLKTELPGPSSCQLHERKIAAQQRGASAAKYARRGQVRGHGAMSAIELVDPATDAPEDTLTRAIQKCLYEPGITIPTCEAEDNEFRFLPP